MAKNKATLLHISDDLIVGRIHMIRGKQVMLDRDLAELYGVETKRLNEQVTRNIKRFPKDFMFRLAKEEFDYLQSQIATSSWGGTRTPPRVFTEQGVAMLSGVLRGDTAIAVHIQIIRAFTKLRHMITNYEQLWNKLERLEAEQAKQNEQMAKVFKALKQLLIEEEKPQREIGFKYPKLDS